MNNLLTTAQGNLAFDQGNTCGSLRPSLRGIFAEAIFSLSERLLHFVRNDDRVNDHLRQPLVLIYLMTLTI